MLNLILTTKTKIRRFYMINKYFNINKRIYIENQLKFQIKISEIAKKLNRSISTVMNKVDINKDNSNYFCLNTQNKAEQRKQTHITCHKFNDKKLANYVQQKL